MRTINVFTLILFVLASFAAKAQTTTASASVKKSDEIKNRVIIMTDEKEPFTVFLNGKKMTPKPGTNHTLENLDRQSFDLKIDFFRDVADIKKNLMVKEGKEATYILRKVNDKQFVFQLKEEKDLPNYKNKLQGTPNLTGGNSGSASAGTRPKADVEEKTNNRVIIYNDSKEPFTILLNGKIMTPKPGTTHTLENLDRQSYDLKIDFYRDVADVKKNLMVKEGKEATYILRKVNDKQFTFQLKEEKDLPNYKNKLQGTPNLTGGNSGSASAGTNPKANVPEEKNNRVIIYNDTKEPFTIFLNGEKVTPSPGTTHTLENLERESYNLKIDFYRNIKSINKNLLVKEGKETTFKLKKVKEGLYNFQLEGERTLPNKKGGNHNLGPQGSKKKVTTHTTNQAMLM